MRKAAELLAKAGQAGEPSSRTLYVFSDRTAAGWDVDEAKRIKMPDGVQAVYIDLGVDQPRDLGIEKIEVNPLVVAPGGAVTVTADLRAVGADFDANLLCQLDNEANPASRRVKLTAGKDREVFDPQGADARAAAGRRRRGRTPNRIRSSSSSARSTTGPSRTICRTTTCDSPHFRCATIPSVRGGRC